MKLHLYTIIPAALLVILQFIPVIRHKLMLFHRMNGYIVVILSLISNAGTIIITRHAFGGDFATQTWTGAMVILTTVGYIMAWVNIKLLQIDQHRAWMLRTWAWVCLLSLAPLPRVITLLMCFTVLNNHHNQNHHDHLRPNHKHKSKLVYSSPLRPNRLCPRSKRHSRVLPTMSRLLHRRHTKPPCHRNRRLCIFEQHGVIRCTRDPLWSSRMVGPSNPHLRNRMLRKSQTPSFSKSKQGDDRQRILMINLQLKLTPKESSRLRQRSYERQLETGMSRPGYAGLSVERFGDAEPFKPDLKIVDQESVVKV
jgi:hypothetical protein